MITQLRNLTENVKFYHIRAVYPVCVGFGSEEYPMYDLAIDNLGGVTVAYTRNQDDTVNWALAKCSGKENYCKRTGRKISSGRLASGKFETGTWEEFQEFVGSLEL